MTERIFNGKQQIQMAWAGEMGEGNKIDQHL